MEWKGTHSKKAVEPYSLWLARFNEITNKPIGDVGIADITKFSNWVQSHYSTTTHYYAMTILHIFFNFENRRGRGLPADDIKTKRVHANSHLPAEEDEYQALIKTFNTDNYSELRNLCMLRLLGDCGMRVSELTNLNCNDIDLREHLARIRNAKSVRERRIVWSDNTNNLLAGYLAQRSQYSSSPALFLGAHSDGTMSERITTRSVQRMIKLACKHAGIEKKITPHSMRHHAAIRSRRNGASIAFVQKMLGHSNPTTTIDTYEQYGIDEFTDEARRYLEHNTQPSVYVPLIRKLEKQEAERTEQIKSIFDHKP
ncbi:MAG: tyrosine-type recombinase/integrase [bacterium]|nr:tyrosine-type recombinase/integrase [bacterium]